MNCYKTKIKIQIYILNKLEYEGYILQAFDGKLGVGTLYAESNWEKVFWGLIKNGIKVENEKIKFTNAEELVTYLKDIGLNIKVKGV